jgi:hypothetical protein
MGNRSSRRLATVTYVAHPDAGRHWCVYCGMPAEVRDHFFPRAAVSQWYGIMQSRHVRRLCFTVPSCAECNGLLGARIALTFPSRRHLLRQRLEAKYRKLILSPAWSEEELYELRGRLREHVRAKQLERDIVKSRLIYEHDKEIGPLEDPVPVDWRAQKIAEDWMDEAA